MNIQSLLLPGTVFQSFLKVVSFNIRRSEICRHGSSVAPQCELSHLCHYQSSRLPSAELVPLRLLVIQMTARQPSGVAEGVKVDEVETIMRCKTCKIPGPKKEE